MAFIDLPPELPAVEIVQPLPRRIDVPTADSLAITTTLIAEAVKASEVALEASVTAPLFSIPATALPNIYPSSSELPTSNSSTPLTSESANPETVDSGASVADPPEIRKPETGPETGPETRPETDDVEPMVPSDPQQVPEPRLDITADYQEYDPIRQIVTASGNVLLKLNDAFLRADQLQVNLLNRYTLAQGNVLLTRGNQVIRGQRAEYNLTQGTGVIFEATGELALSTLSTDFQSPLNNTFLGQSAVDPLNPDEPLTAVSSAGGIQFGTSPGSNFPNAEGGLRRLRFEAERVYFDADIWQAENLRITNDPFSPPELELQANSVTLMSVSPEQDLLTAQQGKFVFDQGFGLPLVRSQVLLNRGMINPDDLNPLPTGIGIDGRDRGGLFIERRFAIAQQPNFSASITPQYLVTRGLSEGVVDPRAFGVKVDANLQLSPRTAITAEANLSSLNIEDFTEKLRANVRAQQQVGDHSLALEYSYRDRLFNGSLGFQDVRSTLGAVLLSPRYQLNQRGLGLSYQLGAQYITAETDRTELLGINPRDNLVSLGRFQSSIFLSQGFNLWQGEGLPATPTEGLRYSPFAIVPRVDLNLGLQGTGTYYTSSDFQNLLTGSAQITLQFGHLSKPILDYTRLQLGYSQAFISGNDSPFTFDRAVDTRTISVGLMQQVYGPFLLGFQSAFNLDTGEEINTDLIFEYSRRTYGILVRYSPTQSTGFLGFRLSGFNWLGNSDPFDNPRIRRVEDGVVR